MCVFTPVFRYFRSTRLDRIYPSWICFRTETCQCIYSLLAASCRCSTLSNSQVAKFKATCNKAKNTTACSLSSSSTHKYWLHLVGNKQSVLHQLKDVNQQGISNLVFIKKSGSIRVLQWPPSTSNYPYRKAIFDAAAVSQTPGSSCRKTVSPESNRKLWA